MNDQAPDNPGDDATDGRKGPPAESATGRPIWPYRSEAEVEKAAQRFGARNIKQFQKREIMDRLLASMPLSAKAVPFLCEDFHKENMGMRHQLLDFFRLLVEKGADLSESANELAKYISDSNFKLREKAKDLFLTMGPGASPAVKRITGYLRHSVPDVRMAAIEVLGAIGPECREDAVPKLERLLKSVTGRDAEAMSAIHRSLTMIKSGSGFKRQRPRSPEAGQPAAADSNTAISEEAQLQAKLAEALRGVPKPNRHEGSPAVPEEAAPAKRARPPSMDAPAEPRVAEVAEEPPTATEGPGPLRAGGLAEMYPNLREAKVLLIEDDDRMRQAIHDRLARLGARVVEADNGRDGLKAIVEAAEGGAPYDLILLDLILPVMNGALVLAEMKRRGDLKRTRAFVLSARQEKKLVLAALRMGVAGFIAKPFRFQDLLPRLNASLGGE